MKFLEFLLTVVVSCSLLQAQRLARFLDSYDEGQHFGVSDDAEWSLSRAGELLWISLLAPKSASSMTGIASPGGMFILSSSEILICGAEGSSGVCEHWTNTNDVLSLRSRVIIPGADFVGVVYAVSNGNLYLLDDVGKRLLRAPWSPLTSLATSTFSVIADQMAIPDLAHTDRRTLVLEGSGAPVKLRLMKWPLMPVQAGYTLTDAGASLVLGSFAVTRGVPTADVSADQTSATDGGGVLRVFVPAGVSFEVVDLTSDMVIGTGTGGAGGVTTISLSQALVLGHRYTARRTGQAVPGDEGFQCTIRYGVPESFLDGTVIDPMYFQLGARIGETFFVEVGLRNSAFAQLSSDISYSGILLIGFRVGGADPVVPYGNNLLLSTGTYVPAAGFVARQNGWGLAYSALTIPADPGLVGLTFLVQFVIEEGQDYRLSEIYGSTIEGSSGSATMFSSATAAAPDPTQALFAGHLHMNAALMSGRVFDATPRLIQILSRRQ